MKKASAFFNRLSEDEAFELEYELFMKNVTPERTIAAIIEFAKEMGYRVAPDDFKEYYKEHESL